MFSLVVMTAIMSQAANNRRPPEVIEMCAAIESLMSITNGSYVRVRGELVMTAEGDSLRGIDCSRGFLTNGLRWIDSFSLASAGAKGLLFPDTFKTDPEQREQNMEFYQKKAAGVRVTVTVEGRLERREQYWRRIGHGGQAYGNGFGHLGAFPAVLVVHRMVDVVFSPSPTPAVGGGKN